MQKRVVCTQCQRRRNIKYMQQNGTAYQCKNCSEDLKTRFDADKKRDNPNQTKLW